MAFWPAPVRGGRKLYITVGALLSDCFFVCVEHSDLRQRKLEKPLRLTLGRRFILIYFLSGALSLEAACGSKTSNVDFRGVWGAATLRAVWVRELLGKARCLQGR